MAMFYVVKNLFESITCVTYKMKHRIIFNRSEYTIHDITFEITICSFI